MSGQTGNLYKVKKTEIQKTGVVLTDAFQYDPFWKKILKEVNIYQKRAFFESSVRYGLKYGKVFATSENMEGIAVWVPGDYADVTIWRAIRSGSFFSTMKMGLKMGLEMKSIFEPLEAGRKANMKGKVYIYFMVIGVATEYQRQGFGRKLIGALIEESEQGGLPVYLETTTEDNVKMYERIGFRTLGQITLPIVSLPQWSMVREPGT